MCVLSHLCSTCVVALTCVCGRAGAYLIAVCTPLLIAAYLTVSPALQSPSIVRTRNMLLAATVAGGVIPATHWALADQSHCRAGVLWAVIAMFGFYGLGFLFFTTRFPEAHTPHMVLDYIGSSHNIWHVCVWLAGASWLEGMVQYYECKHSDVCAVPFWEAFTYVMNASIDQEL